MKTIVRTITVFVALSLVTASFALGQESAEKEDQEALRRMLQEKRMQDEKRILAEKRRKRAEADRQRRQELQLARELADVAREADEPVEHLTRSLVLATMPQYTGAGRVLVVPAEETKVQDIITIMEDLNVMSRILDKKLKDARLGKDFDWFYGSSFLEWNLPVTKSIYLEDYGVLFLKQVDFLISPPGKPKGAEETAEGFDPVWERTKREIYFPKDVWRHRHKKRPSKEYDALKVEDLKRTLIEALKHAANIRNLESNECVILTVIGEGGVAGGVSKTVRLRVDAEEPVIEESVTTSVSGESDVYSSTVLTIRAEKSDVDDFAEGKLDFEQFQEKVQIFTY